MTKKKNPKNHKNPLGSQDRESTITSSKAVSFQKFEGPTHPGKAN